MQKKQKKGRSRHYKRGKEGRQWGAIAFHLLKALYWKKKMISQDPRKGNHQKIRL